MALFPKANRSSKRAGAKFPTTSKGGGVRVSPGKGGAGRIGPSHCTAKRAHRNVKSSY